MYKALNLPIVVARPFNTFGPRQSLRAVIPTIICQFLKSKNNKADIKLGVHQPKRLCLRQRYLNGLIKIMLIELIMVKYIILQQIIPTKYQMSLNIFLK